MSGTKQNVPAPTTHHIDKRALDVIIADLEKDKDKDKDDDDDLLSTGEVAAWLKVSTQFLEIGRHKGYGPKFTRLSVRRVRYRRGDVRAWLLERTYASTAAYAR